MLTVFQVCFWLGVIVTVCNAVLGCLFDLVDFGIDLDLDLDLDFGGFDLGNFLPLSPSLFFLHLTVFGGVGLILYGKLLTVLVILIGLAAASCVTALINRFVLGPLRRLSSKDTAGNEDYLGQSAEVSEKIFAGGFGKVTLTADDNLISLPAKAEYELSVGTQVIILEISGGVCTVEPLNSVLRGTRETSV